MANIYQVIEDMKFDPMKDLLCDRQGYKLPNDASEYSLRETIRDLYARNLLSGRDIREMAEGGV